MLAKLFLVPPNPRPSLRPWKKVHRKLEDRNRKLEIFTAPTKAKWREPAYSQARRVLNSRPKHVRGAESTADRLLRTRPTFSKSPMVSVGVSSLGRTSIHFVE